MTGDDVTNEPADEPETFHTAGANIGLSRVSRRGFMRAATAGGAAAAVGGASLSTDQLGARRAEASPIHAAVGAAFLAGYGGAYIYDELTDGEDIDLSDADAEQRYIEARSAAQSVFWSSEADWTGLMNSWRLEYDRSEDSLYYDDGYIEEYPWAMPESLTIGDEQSSDYLNQTWSEIRNYIDQQYTNGVDQTEAIQNCIDDVLKPHSIRAFTNILKSYNGHHRSFINIASQIVDLDEAGDMAGEIYISDGEMQAHSNIGYVPGGVDDLEFAQGDGGWRAAPIEFEIPPSEVGAETEDTWQVIETSLQKLTAEIDDNIPFVDLHEDVEPQYGTGTFGVYESDDDGEYIISTDDVAGRAWYPVFVGPLYTFAVRKLGEQYSQLQDDIGNYAATVYSAYDGGDADPGDAITATELIEHRDDASQTDRITAELAASGYLTQEQLTNQQTVTVQHPDVDAADNEDSGLLYLDSDADVTVEEGEVIASDDYEGAYFVTDGDGDTEVSLLSGEEDLTIVESAADEPLEYQQWTPKVNDPTDEDEFVETVEETEELRSEIEALREQMAEQQAGGGGIALPSNPLAGISNTAAAAGAGVVALIFGSIALGGGD